VEDAQYPTQWSTPQYDFTILTAGSITELEILTEEKEIALPNIQALAIDQFLKKEEVAVRDAAVAASKIGVNVSQDAQNIFDALSKTYHL
jgi:hypothetical protein